METKNTTVEQGSILRLGTEEIGAVKDILEKKGMSWELLDSQQGVLKLPQQYVGYIGLPTRRIIIKPKHNGITISHILRVYYFLYSAEYSDIDTPMYDIESGNDVNLIKMFIQELLLVVHKGIPIAYEEVMDNLNFVRGNLQVVPTKMNMLMKRNESFVCSFDDLTRDTDVNRVLLAAAKKVEKHEKSTDLAYAIRQFGDINNIEIPETVKLNKNTAYCKKAISLAYMILNDMTLSSDGEDSSGESLLINFDKVYEDFIKKILMEFSSQGKFSYWSSGKIYARSNTKDGYIERKYIPDLLYDYKEEYGSPKARAILDMKNKTSSPFHNADVYQMVFYGEMLCCKKIILCYPSSIDEASCALRFEDEKFYLQKIYAVYMNLAGNTAKDFKNNIRLFITKIEYLL